VHCCLPPTISSKGTNSLAAIDAPSLALEGRDFAIPLREQLILIFGVAAPTPGAMPTSVAESACLPGACADPLIDHPSGLPIRPSLLRSCSWLRELVLPIRCPPFSDPIFHWPHFCPHRLRPLPTFESPGNSTPWSWKHRSDYTLERAAAALSFGEPSQ
jgi:hypothetical protein